MWVNTCSHYLSDDRTLFNAYGLLLLLSGHMNDIFGLFSGSIFSSKNWRQIWETAVITSLTAFSPLILLWLSSPLHHHYPHHFNYNHHYPLHHLLLLHILKLNAPTEWVSIRRGEDPDKLLSNSCVSRINRLLYPLRRKWEAPTFMYISSEAVLKRRKELLPTLRAARERGDIASLKYDKLVIKSRSRNAQIPSWKVCTVHSLPFILFNCAGF